MDKLVTGIIIGGAAASIFGLSRTKKGKKFTERMMSHCWEYLKWWVSLFWKATVKLLSLFQKKK